MGIVLLHIKRETRGRKVWGQIRFLRVIRVIICLSLKTRYPRHKNLTQNPGPMRRQSRPRLYRLRIPTSTTQNLSPE